MKDEKKPVGVMSSRLRKASLLGNVKRRHCDPPRFTMFLACLRAFFKRSELEKHSDVGLKTLVLK